MNGGIGAIWGYIRFRIEMYSEIFLNLGIP